MALEANPIAARRTADLVVDLHGDETIVLDTRSDAVHYLPVEIATVWDCCDGTRTAADVALATGIDRAIVDSSIEQLMHLGLLDAPGMDRRRFLRRSALVGGSLAVAPLIQSIVAPAVNAAASVVPPSCHAQVSQLGTCHNNKADYSLTVSGLSPNTSYNVVVTYKNSSVADNYAIQTDASGGSTSTHTTGAAIPHNQTVQVSIKVYSLSGALICQDLDTAFLGC